MHDIAQCGDVLGRRRLQDTMTEIEHEPPAGGFFQDTPGFMLHGGAAGQQHRRIQISLYCLQPLQFFPRPIERHRLIQPQRIDRAEAAHRLVSA